MKRELRGTIVQEILAIIFGVLGAIFTVTAGVLVVVRALCVPGNMVLMILAITFASVGVPFILVGAGFAAFVKNKRTAQAELKASGRTVIGRVVDYRVNYQVSLNGRHPKKLICEVEDSFTGTKSTYVSDNYWDDPEAMRGREVTIYVDRDDSRKYFVEI